MQKVTINYQTRAYLKQKNGQMKPFLVSLKWQDICFYKEEEDGSA
jgi:hypothetical protein